MRVWKPKQLIWVKMWNELSYTENAASLSDVIIAVQ
jgi:hypothetical protein